MPSNSICIAIVVRIIPINRSMAFKTFSPNHNNKRSEMPKINELAIQAASSATTLNGQYESWRLEIKISVTIVDGPAIMGMANGTINGSSAIISWCIAPKYGKIIRIAIRNRIKPPEIVKAGSEICMASRRYLPKKRKRHRIPSAMSSSLNNIVLLLV